jgi:hypothetical protein
MTENEAHILADLINLITEVKHCQQSNDLSGLNLKDYIYTVNWILHTNGYNIEKIWSGEDQLTSS